MGESGLVMKSKLFLCGSMLLLASTTLAQQPAAKPSATPDPAALRKHVTYLASDELGGRKPGEAGGDKAAAYIAEQFQKAKLGCATPNLKCKHTGNVRSGYFQQFPFIAGVELGAKNTLAVTAGEDRSTPALGEQWIPIGFSSNGGLENARLVFAGYGITAAELKHDDYGSVDVKDKIAVVFAGTPDGDNPHGQFGRFGDVRFKAVAAKEHGAKALIVISGEEKFAADRLSKLSYDQTSGEAGIIVIAVSRQTAAKWFSSPGVSELTALEKTPGDWAAASQKLSGVGVNLSVDVVRKAVPAYNVVGIIEGSDPKLKKEYIVIGAHYDHLGRGGESSLAPNSTEPHHGADDNASGSAGVIELARIFASERKQLKRSLVFAAFSAEESGLIGSKAYIGAPPVPLADTVAMINMDMIGRLRDGKLTVGGVGTSPEFRKLVEGAGKDSFTLQLNEDGFGPSDHSSFYAKQIPVLFFFTGTHEDYHKPSDTADKINYDGEAKILGMTATLAREIERADARPAYTLAKSQNAGRSSGFRVYLGTVPNYAESNDGMLLDAVRDDSPAAKAGLKAGDKIVKLAGREIKNVYDYTYALGEMKAEQEYDVEVMRDGQRAAFKLTPQARK